MFKEIVQKLTDSSDGEGSEMWSLFRKENLTPHIIKEKLKIDPGNKRNDYLYKMLEKYKSKDLLSIDDDQFWENLFFKFRDIGCRMMDIKGDQMLSVLIAGKKHEMTFADLGKKVMTDYGDILDTQTAIPDTVHYTRNNSSYKEDKNMLMDELKSAYESQVKGKNEEQSDRILSQIKKSYEAKCIKDMQSLEAEVFVQQKLIELGRKKNIKMVVFRGIKTYEHIGKNIFGLNLSKFSNKEKEEANIEVEHDIMTLAFSGEKLNIIFIQVKTSENSKPWEENIEEQNAGRLPDAKKQLQKDILRFAELLPDHSIGNGIDFKFFAAFPLLFQKEEKGENGFSILSGPDFESADRLNEKLLLTETHTNNSETFEKGKILSMSILGRYLGVHSIIPMKNKVEAFQAEVKLIDKSITEIESAIQHVPSEKRYLEIESERSIEIFQKNLRARLSGVEVIQPIFKAIDHKGYKKGTFHKQYDNYPGHDVGKFDIDKTKEDSKYPFQIKSSEKFLLVGREQIKIFMEYFDEKLGHQGLGKLEDKLNTENVEIYELLPKDENEKNKFEKIDKISEIVRRYFDCEQCKIKETLLRKNVQNQNHEGIVILSDSNDVLKALEYADYHHKGFHEACRRLKSWCNFDNFEAKIQENCRNCPQCSAKLTCILLSKQQMTAIRNDNPLRMKIIQGPFGSGKTTVGKVMMENQKCHQNYFVIMRESRSDNMKLKDLFKQQFKSPLEGATIKSFTFKQALQRFEISGSDVRDELVGIKKIVEKLKSGTAIFFDETPIVRSDVLTEEAMDWTALEIKRKDIFVVISFQPLIESVRKNRKPIKPRFHKTSSIVELNKVYRTSKSIFKCVHDSLQWENGIKSLECKATPIEVVPGKVPTLISYGPSDDIFVIKFWIQNVLKKLKCPDALITILYTANTEIDAKNMFRDSFSNSLIPWEEFRGCENKVIICFYSSDEDETWHLMAMASRAQQTLIILNKIVDESKASFTEIENVQHYIFEDIVDEGSQDPDFIAMKKLIREKKGNEPITLNDFTRVMNGVSGKLSKDIKLIDMRVQDLEKKVK